MIATAGENAQAGSLIGEACMARRVIPPLVLGPRPLRTRPVEDARSVTTIFRMLVAAATRNTSRTLVALRAS
jgi:hypothetical protein